MEAEFLLEKFDSGMHYIVLDKETVSALTKNGSNRVLCQLNGKGTFHCAIMPKKQEGYYINIGATICKKLKITAGSKVHALFSSDETEYQFEMPEELKEVLNSDLEASTIFQTLTKGNQRSLMYLVSQVKTVDKRIERSFKIVEKIKKGITSPKVILK